MTEGTVTEWLAEWNQLDPAELHTFAEQHEEDDQIEHSIYSVFEERIKYSKLIEPVCVQLIGFYRSGEDKLQQFSLQFLPTLIYVYVNAVANNDKKSHKSIETFLIGLYNLEVKDENEKPKVVSFRLPSLAQASLYHEPLTLGPAFLTESSLRRWEECNTKLVNWGPLLQIESLNAQNRIKVMTALLFVFNRQLSLFSKSTLRQLCITASRFVLQGFSNLSMKQNNTGTPQLDHRSTHNLPSRIPVSSQFLLELVHGVYFAMFNEFYTLAQQALNDIAARACYEGYPDVLLVTNAITNSLQANPSGQPCDGPMGISVALSPATTTVTMSKSMITNASFRTKKLPDDIPIQIGATNPTEAPEALNSIVEETETEVNATRNSSLRNSKSKLPSFPGLGKKVRDKEKDIKMSVIKTGGVPNEAPKKSLLLSSKENKVHGKGVVVATNGDGADYMSPSFQKKVTNDVLDSNNSLISEEKVSLVSDSLQANVDNSDAHSQTPVDSLDIDNTTKRISSMQVSSV